MSLHAGLDEVYQVKSSIRDISCLFSSHSYCPEPVGEYKSWTHAAETPHEMTCNHECDHISALQWPKNMTQRVVNGINFDWKGIQALVLLACDDEMPDQPITAKYHVTWLILSCTLVCDNARCINISGVKSQFLCPWEPALRGQIWPVRAGSQGSDLTR